MNKKVKFLENCLTEVFEERRAVLITHMKQRLAQVLEGKLQNRTAESLRENSWEEIDSLSKLRALVGGRFENLKNKWLSAGFPLKQDKSAKPGVYSLNEKGWVELSSWISNQGFEVRLNPEKKNIIFEIKSNN